MRSQRDQPPWCSRRSTKGRSPAATRAATNVRHTPTALTITSMNPGRSSAEAVGVGQEAAAAGTGRGRGRTRQVAHRHPVPGGHREVPHGPAGRGEVEVEDRQGLALAGTRRSRGTRRCGRAAGRPGVGQLGRPGRTSRRTAPRRRPRGTSAAASRPTPGSVRRRPTRGAGRCGTSPGMNSSSSTPSTTGPVGTGRLDEPPGPQAAQERVERLASSPAPAAARSHPGGTPHRGCAMPPPSGSSLLMSVTSP